MNREILFRGKSGQTWYYGFLTGEKHYIGAEGCNNWTYRWHIYTKDKDTLWVKEDTIGQFTGFMDSEQNKIFEGDIIEIGRFYNNNFRTAGNYLCRYDSGSAAFVFTYIIPKDISSVDRYALLNDSVGLGDLIGCSLKVIGNIYDNPELLSEESECV